jgi:hypothetical protein
MIKNVIKIGGIIVKNSFFWGLLLIFVGISYIARQVFAIHLPTTTIVFSFILILGGVSILRGNSSTEHRRNRDSDGYNFNNTENFSDNAGYNGKNSSFTEEKYDENMNSDQYSNTGYKYGSKKEIIFSNGEIQATGMQDKYDVIFSDGIVDFTLVPVPLNNITIKVDIVFSKGIIRINESIPAVIRVGAVFSNARMPDGSQITFGNYTYTTQAYREGMPHYNIKSDVVFSDIKFLS